MSTGVYVPEVSQYRSLAAIAYSSEEIFLSLLGFTRYTRNRDREKSLAQTHLFNI
jgi:hypothetical protein